MIGSVKRLMLRVLKVPPEPRLPVGAAESARKFRASRRYLQLKLLNWGVSQFFTLIGLIAALVALHFIGTGTFEVLDKVPHRGIILRFAGWFEVIGNTFPFFTSSSRMLYAKDERALLGPTSMKVLQPS